MFVFPFGDLFREGGKLVGVIGVGGSLCQGGQLFIVAGLQYKSQFLLFPILPLHIHQLIFNFLSLFPRLPTQSIHFNS